ncbi:MAG TPA: UbiA family prenyltransferase [Gammaproteobacteria bacterium]|nr:hypothetical protein [Gammaproteobacteria bacterium]MEC8010411.1 UbiA family prenyltransferase [Pseudomonadota bacterium]HBF09424.1 UbiA family prenyltransferase [Gammaproteobacteria bacterium]HCK94560.1 UbiA family prenyltransferase [Gammaproteobacteria bacterium]|tara:strand:- start:30770 stop:32260 length:1491 start_codon:yes stop_codon:yes gene_type:complete
MKETGQEHLNNADVQASASDKQVPLCVDLDGSLILTDTLYESVAQLIKQNWLMAFMVPFWFFKGKAFLKNQLAKHCDLAVDRFPLHNDFKAWLETEKANGRRLVLVTGTHEKYANAFAQHIQLFDEVIATTPLVNCTSHNKANRLVEEYGERGFDYAGNHSVDANVWKFARHAIVVNASGAVISAAQNTALAVERVFPPQYKINFKVIRKALRVHQWMKNLLIFVPLMTAHMFTSSAAIGSAIFAFIIMSICASATYFINDLLDLEADRNHHTKCNRPFASGAIPINKGAMAAAAMLGFSFLSALIFMPFEFFFILFSYLVLTLTYSLSFKRLQSLDVVSLAMLYTIRVLAGAAAIGVTVSFWLLAFSLFIFLSLGLVKRVSELQKLVEQNKTFVEGRGYEVADLPVLQSLGSASGYLAILVISLYIHSPEVSLLYDKPQILWLICPILTVWITRIWVLTARGQVDEDPVEYAIKDRFTWAAGGICLAILIIAAFA